MVRLRKPTATLFSFVLLGGCHGDVANPRQLEALNGCTERWRIEFPELYGEANDVTKRRALAVMMPDKITFKVDGSFSFEQPPTEWRDSYDIQFVCRGNIVRRTIELIGHGNTVRRPSSGAVWSF